MKKKKSPPTMNVLGWNKEDVERLRELPFDIRPDPVQDPHKELPDGNPTWCANISDLPVKTDEEMAHIRLRMIENNGL